MIQAFVALLCMSLAASTRDELSAWPWPDGSFIPAEIVEIDLDLAPRERWRDVAERYKNVLPRYLSYWKESLLNAFDEESIQTWLQFLDAEEEYVEEMKAFVEACNHPNVTLDILKTFSAMYEMGSPLKSCSGILAAAPNGTVFHARNLDYRKVSVVLDVHFMRGGQYLFQSVSFLGGVGVHTGMRVGGWTVEQNTRANGVGDSLQGAISPTGSSDKPFLDLKAAKLGGKPFSFTVRRAMEQVATFKEAVDTLVQAQYMAPMYFVMAGPGSYEGAIVTTDRVPTPLGYAAVQTLSPQIDKWFLVQTNDDAWDPEVSEKRRSALTSHMETLGQEDVSLSKMQHFLRLPPVGTIDLIYEWTAVVAQSRESTMLAPAGHPSAGPELPAYVWEDYLKEVKVNKTDAEKDLTDLFGPQAQMVVSTTEAPATPNTSSPAATPNASSPAATPNASSPSAMSNTPTPMTTPNTSSQGATPHASTLLATPNVTSPATAPATKAKPLAVHPDAKMAAAAARALTAAQTPAAQATPATASTVSVEEAVVVEATPAQPTQSQQAAWSSGDLGRLLGPRALAKVASSAGDVLNALGKAQAVVSTTEAPATPNASSPWVTLAAPTPMTTPNTSSQTATPNASTPLATPNATSPASATVTTDVAFVVEATPAQPTQNQ